MLTRRAAPLPATVPATALGKPVVPIKIVPPPYGDIHGPSFYAALKVGNSSGPRPDSITSGHNHGGVAGVHINVGYDDVRADLSAYLDNQSYALPAPQEPSVISYGLGAGNQIVTNIHGGVDPVTNTGNCLEAGTALYNTFNDPTTHSIFWVGDFATLVVGQRASPFRLLSLLALRVLTSVTLGTAYHVCRSSSTNRSAATVPGTPSFTIMVRILGAGMICTITTVT